MAAQRGDSDLANKPADTHKRTDLLPGLLNSSIPHPSFTNSSHHLGMIYLYTEVINT
jgi:hypothetical protein